MPPFDTISTFVECPILPTDRPLARSPTTGWAGFWAFSQTPQSLKCNPQRVKHSEIWSPRPVLQFRRQDVRAIQPAFARLRRRRARACPSYRLRAAYHPVDPLYGHF